MGHVQNAEGAKLRYGHAAGRADMGLELAVFGGYTEFAEKYFETMAEWQRAGYGVWFLDWRGQGGSDRYHRERERAILRDLKADARDVHDFIAAKVKGRVCVVGHSLGGHILVRYLHDYPGQAVCAVLSSPTLALGNVTWMPQWLIDAKLGWARWRGQSDDWATDEHEWRVKPEMERQLSSDPVRQKVQREWFEARPELRVGGVTYAWVDAFLKSSFEILKPDYLAKIKTPVLMGCAEGDVLASVAAQREAARWLPEVTRVEFAPALHELLMEADRVREPWMTLIQKFLEKNRLLKQLI